MVLTLNQEMNNASATIRPNNSSPTSPVELFPSKVEGAVFCSVLATEAALIVASNLLTLFLFAVTKKLRKRSLFLVCSMACADLMIGTLSLPGYIYLYVGNQYMLWEANVDLSLDIFFVAVEVIFSQASLISAASISFERLYAVYWPLKHRTLTVRLYHLAIFIVWTLAALISALVNLSYFIISHKVSIHFWISYAFTLLLILCGCNIAIWRKVRRRSNPASHLQNRAIQNQRLTKTLLFVSIFPLLTWLPLIIVNYFYSLEIVSMSLNTYYIFVIINSSHYFVNPVVYVLRIPEFRQAFGWCCFRRQPVRVINEERPSRHNRDVVMTQPFTLQTQGLNRLLAFEQIVEDIKL